MRPDAARAPHQGTPDTDNITSPNGRHIAKGRPDGIR